jgi:murein DD-endopeptidase MepM/ murein hydrolase activator NlpD
MKIVLLQKAGSKVTIFFKTFWEFCLFFIGFIRSKIVSASISFEKNKNRLVKLFLIKRGRYNRPFLHFATMLVLFIGVLIGPFLADTYPIFASNTSQILGEQVKPAAQSVDVSNDVFETKVSKKPRDKIEIYTVQKGDTLSTIANKFEISANTIRWANDLSSDNISIGDQLKILPITGIAYKVLEGDTVYSIAKKFDTEPQKIVDFVFNDFANPETFSLIEGQMLFVPDGVPLSSRQGYIRETYIVTGPVTISASGFTWPLRGAISQFSSWYHTAVDITSPVGTPIVSAQDGVVSKITLGTWDFGYGNNVYVTSSNGMGSHYAHMSAVNVTIGQTVTAGKTVIGWVGMTGRTTGPHLHFEVSQSGTLVDPMSVLR